MFVSLTGGELFLRRDAFEIAEHARTIGMAITILTSGTRFNGTDLDRVAAIHPLSVDVSLYSATSDVHDFITRRPGSHASTMKAIVGLRERGVPVLVKAPILKPNLGEIQGVVDFAESVGADYTFDPTVITRRDGRCEPVELRASPSELATVLSNPALRRGRPLLSGPRDRGDAPCAIARRVAVILPNGDVMPCSLHPESAGNVEEEPFGKIWAESALLASLRALTVGSLDDGCASCSKNGYCGRCSALALLEHGDFLGPSASSCNLAEAREMAAGLASMSTRRTRLRVVS
jgi:radical SAM protein with 4Fe4S-binding SPASM domain